MSLRDGRLRAAIKFPSLPDESNTRCMYTIASEHRRVTSLSTIPLIQLAEHTCWKRPHHNRRISGFLSRSEESGKPATALRAPKKDCGRASELSTRVGMLARSQVGRKGLEIQKRRKSTYSCRAVGRTSRIMLREGSVRYGFVSEGNVRCRRPDG